MITTILLRCETCAGNGVSRITTGGHMSDWIEVTCGGCHGASETPATDEEMAELDRMHEAYVMSEADALEAAQERAVATATMRRDADLDAYVERMVEQEFGEGEDDDPDPTPFAVTASNPPFHPGMTPQFFDLAVKRAFDAELAIQRTSRASVVAVSSVVDADVSYLVTATECGCAGHLHHGRCLHRAFALWFWWAVGSEVAMPVSQTAA